MSFQSYTADARDANRTTTLKTLSDGLTIYQTKNATYPMPDSPVTISISGTIISYQGLAGPTVLSSIKSSEAKDPSDNAYYTYLIDKDKNDFQLLAMLENNPNITAYNQINLTEQSYARDYTNRYTKTLGNSLGILLDSATNTPIRTNTDLFLAQSGTTYKAVITDKVTKTLKGVELGGPLQMLALKGGSFARPSTCEEGYIPVPGNPDFMQPGFCAAKYEMSYITPNNITTLPDWETDDYSASKTDIASKAGGYAITQITQSGAIESCKIIGGHLITNNEWMTVSRNIEKVPSNWSNGLVGSGFIYNGRSEELTMGCDGNRDGNWVELTGTECSEKKTNGKSRNVLELSNGEEIYDLAGNVWEHVNKANTIDGTNYANGKTKLSNTTGWPTAGTAPNNYYYWHNQGWNGTNITIEERNNYGPSDSTYGTGAGMGNINGWYIDDTIYPHNIFLRGAGASNTSYASVFTLNLTQYLTTVQSNIGFRCAK